MQEERIECSVWQIHICTSVLETEIRTHYNNVIMGSIASQITSLTIVFASVYSDADQGKHQNFASLAFVWGIHRRPVNSPHKWPVTWKTFPFDDVIMRCLSLVFIQAWNVSEFWEWEWILTETVRDRDINLHSKKWINGGQMYCYIHARDIKHVVCI